MSSRLVGVADNSANALARDSLVGSERIAFTNPTSQDRCRARWGRADVVLAGEADALVSRRDGVAIVSVDPSTYSDVFDTVPDPVVVVIAADGAEAPTGSRFVVVRRYPGCCYSIRVPERGEVVVTELSRRPRRSRTRRTRRDRRRRAPAAGAPESTESSAVAESSETEEANG